MQIPIELNKKLGDKAIELLRNELKDLTWIDEVYPAVKIGVRENGDTYPAVYVQSEHRKILDLTPNSKLKSYIFFEKNNYEINENNIYDLSLILWANLRAIDESKEYDQTDDLIADIVHILQNFTCINIDVDFDDVFSKYNLYESTRQMFIYPYSTARIRFKMPLNANC